MTNNPTRARSDFIHRNHGKNTLTETEYDEAVVLRFMRGEQIKSNTVDRDEAVRRLVAQGLSISEIAKQTGLSSRSVSRIKARRNNERIG